MNKLIKIAGGLLALAEPSPLGQALTKLKPALAQAAQKVLDSWQQDDEGYDEEYGHGGVCDDITRAIGDIVSHINGVDVTEGGQEGDDHSWLIAYTDQEAYGVDIPPHIYEVGSWYNWKKKPNVSIQPNHVEIFKINREDLGDTEF